MPNHQLSVEDSRVSLIALKVLFPAQTHQACKCTLMRGTGCYYITWHDKNNHFMRDVWYHLETVNFFKLIEKKLHFVGAYSDVQAT